MTINRDLYVSKPRLRNGTWCVVISNGPSPLDEEINVFRSGSRHEAYQTYRRIRKEQGKGL